MRRWDDQVPIRFQVQVYDSTPAAYVAVAQARNLSLAAARRYATRMARKALRLYGGRITQHNWGAQGGRPHTAEATGAHRLATIYPEAPDHTRAPA